MIQNFQDDREPTKNWKSSKQSPVSLASWIIGGLSQRSWIAVAEENCLFEKDRSKAGLLYILSRKVNLLKV